MFSPPQLSCWVQCVLPGSLLPGDRCLPKTNNPPNPSCDTAKALSVLHPDAEHPCACVPSPGVLLYRHPAVLQWVLLLLNARGSGGIEGSVPPVPPELGWRDPPMHGTTLGTAIPANRDAGARIQLVMRCGLLCALLATPPASPCLCTLPLLPGTLQIFLMENCFLFFAIQGNWHLLVCLGSLFLSAVCTLTSPLASLSPRLSDLWLFHHYLDARRKGNDK